ncbi:DUF4423 domain-containing protein, partial [bacterium]
SFLSQIINGQRPIPLENFEALCSALDLDKESRDELLKRGLQERGLSRPSPIAFNSTPLAERPAAGNTWAAATSKQFSVLENWYVIAILDATLLEDYDGSVGYLAQRLNLSAVVVEETMAKLLMAGLLEEQDGRLMKRTLLMEFNSGAKQAELTSFNKALLERAVETLAHENSPEDRERRLVTGLMITGSAEKVAWAKQAILGIMRQVADEMGNGPAQDLYQLSVQFFPLSRRKGSKQ